MHEAKGTVTTVEDSATVAEAEVKEDGNNVEGVRELMEWATKERWATRFKAKLEDIFQQGGLRIVTDKYLQEIGIVLSPMRTKILEACEMKLLGRKKKTRFGACEYFEPVLPIRPSGKSTWSEIGQMEEKKMTK